MGLQSHHGLLWWSSLRSLAEFISALAGPKSPFPWGCLLLEAACKSSGSSLHTLSQHSRLLLPHQQGRGSLSLPLAKTVLYGNHRSDIPSSSPSSINRTKLQVTLTLKGKPQHKGIKSRRQGSLGCQLILGLSPTMMKKSTSPFCCCVNNKGPHIGSLKPTFIFSVFVAQECGIALLGFLFLLGVYMTEIQVSSAPLAHLRLTVLFHGHQELAPCGWRTEVPFVFLSFFIILDIIDM